MPAFTKLAACLLNISESRNSNIVEAIAKAAVSGNVPSHNVEESQQQSATVLNIFRDFDYNRSVLTIAAPLPVLQRSVYNACVEAYHHIDLGKQVGGHPRLGAVDLLPIYPLSRDVNLAECGSVAKALATSLSRDVAGSSFFLFGTADEPRHRGLVQRRKEVGWFAGKQGYKYKDLKQDVGAIPSSRYGMTGAGASPYVTNCNITIATQDVKFGQEIAKAIRATTPGGLPGIQSMAFAHKGNVEIACNIESVLNTEDTREEPLEGLSLTEERIPSSDNLRLLSQQSLYDHLSYTSADVIEGRVRALAQQRGVDVVGTALIGFTPDKAFRMAVEALTSGQYEYWRIHEAVMM